MRKHRIAPAVAGVMAILGAIRANAQQSILVDLSLTPAVVNAQVGDIIHLKLLANAQMDPGQLIASLELILEWDPGYLKLLRRTSIEDYDWLAEDFPPRSTFDIDGLNDAPRWLDGNAYYIALGQFPPRPFPYITVSGLHVVTFNFQALEVTNQETVHLLPTSPKPDGDLETVVYDGTVPNFPVTGLLVPANIRIVAKLGDFDGDEAVESDDTLDMAACMLGPTVPTSPECAAADLQRDGDADLADFARFMNAYSAAN